MPYSTEENERIRAALDRLVDLHGNQTIVADKLGVTQGWISAFLRGNNGAGAGFARAVADLSGVSLGTLLGMPVDSEPPRDTYPNRALAIVAGRTVGLSEDAIAKCAALRLADGQADPTAKWWLSTLLRLDDELQGPRLA